MTDDVLGAWLAMLPPTKWVRATERAELVRRYLRLDAPTTEDAARHATELGLQQRMFYNLVRIFREGRAGQLHGGSADYADSINPGTARAIEHAIAELGPGATESAVLTAAQDKCASSGYPPPSATAVRTRVGRRHANPDVASRINRTGDLVLDGSPLGLDVHDEAGGIAPANLCGLVHIPSGAVLGHRVVQGTPTEEDGLETLRDALSKPLGTSAHGSGALRLLITSGLLRPPQEVLDDLAGAGIEFDGAGSTHLRRGAALVATLGLRLGRVRLLPLRRSSDAPGGSEPLALGAVGPVIARLIEERNRSLAAQPPCGLTELLPSRRQAADLLELVSNRLR